MGNRFAFIGFVSAGACLAFPIAVGASDGLPQIGFRAPGHVHTVREAPMAFGGAAGAEWRVADWRRKVTASGAFDAHGEARLPLCGVGYYRLSSGTNGAATFAVVPCPEERGHGSDSFYAVDSAQSWVSAPGSLSIPWYGGDSYRLVSDLIFRTGIAHVRERLRWDEVQPRAYAPLDLGRYRYNAALLKARGIAVSGMYHDAPAFASRLVKLPSDLGCVYDFARRAAAAFGDCMDAWEFWNEEDIGFAPEPAWDYAAAFKAAALGFRAARPGVPVLNGALCCGSRSTYDEVLFANDAGRYLDVFNFHTYSPPSDYPAMFAELRGFLAARGLADRPIWLTESGTNQEGHPQHDGARKGLKAHSPEQEWIHAEFYAKSQILLRMEGVSRNYFFVFGAYNERGGHKDWGVLRRDGTVKPVYSAMSAQLKALAGARLLGELAIGKDLRGFLFGHPDGTETLAFWSVSPVDTTYSVDAKRLPDLSRTFTLAGAPGNYRLTDFCGRETAVSNLTLSATRYPAYLSGLRGLAATRPPVEWGRSSAPVPAADEDLTVIFRADLDPHDFTVGGHKSTANLVAGKGRIRITAWNVSAEEKRGSVSTAGGRLTGLPAEIALPPWGHASFDCVYESPAGDASVAHDLTVSGCFCGRRTTRLTIPVRDEVRFLATCVSRKLATDDPAAWQRNTSAPHYKAVWDEAEKAVRFDVDWNGSSVDRWFYPVYTLRPEETLAGAAMLSFEVKTAQDKVENDFSHTLLMLLPKPGAGRQRCVTYAPPLGQWETRRVDLGSASGLQPGQVGSFRLGCNPRGKRLTFWIRNVNVLRAAHSAVAK